MKIKVAFPSVLKNYYRDCRSLFTLIYYRLKLRGMKYPKLHFYSNTEVVDMIVNDGMSLARFGDGEFSWMLGKNVASSYQVATEDLAKRLSQVKDSNNEKLLIGVLKILNDESNMNFRARAHWVKFKANNQAAIMTLLDCERMYADSSITRPYIDLKDKSAASDEFRNLKRIWQDKRVLLVEGKESRLGVGNDLFDGAQIVERLLCPSRNAFAVYESILVKTLLHARNHDIVLLALGPTATILASDLCDRGVQAVDIGHVDNEYEWMLMGARRKAAIPGKAVDEVSSVVLGSNDDLKYRRSIIEEL